MTIKPNIFRLKALLEYLDRIVNILRNPCIDIGLMLAKFFAQCPSECVEFVVLVVDQKNSLTSFILLQGKPCL